MTKIRTFIKVTGIVQGVGFRPFIYNLALRYDLKGWVNNNSEGVYIDIEGKSELVKIFIENIKDEAPPLSRVETVEIEEKELVNFEDFTIKESERNENNITLISPDIATCADCVNDILDPKNRRYKYPFTNCTNCGPRFSIIKTIPYDRDKTTMEKFKMCNPCSEEYTNPADRRFHAQPNACDDCGPHLWITDNKGLDLEIESPIEWTQNMLKEGKIFAIKGLTGFHLVCDGKNEKAVELLRVRKKRPHKPFAVMMKDITTAKKYCNVNSLEEALLTGIRKPIVLLDQNKNFNLPNAIAPNQKTLGVMLPFTPLHELLFQENIEVLIMTSANVYGLPLEYTNEGALDKLSTIVDYFLMHDRDIYIPVDDSVVKVVTGKEIMIRRARGYAPEPFNYKDIKSILATGSNMKNTFCIAKENFLFLSQHNGDLENVETFEHYKKNIEHFKNIFAFEPKFIACDMHPQYASTEYVEDYSLPKIQVQHHHAHIVSCMVENNINNKVIGVSFDGTGYGIDGKIWGGEFLLCDLKEFSRAGHLEYVKMVGGDKSITEPWRMGVSYLYNSFNNIVHDIANKIYGPKATPLISVLEKNINCTETSSIGRFFDAVSSIIGVRDIITYEGQASIELEALIRNYSEDSYKYSIRKVNNTYIVEPDQIIRSIVEDKFSGVSKETMAIKFHNSVVNFTLDICIKLREDTNLNEVALSGGVFQNSYLLENLTLSLEKNDFKVYTHKNIPSNDGGIALGQIICANEKLNKLKE